MRPRDLRHTHVALLIAAGEDLYAISQQLGHAIGPKAATGRPPTASEPPGLELSRTLRGLDAIRRALTQPLKQRNPLQSTGGFEEWS